MSDSYMKYAELINRQFTGIFDSIYRSSNKNQRSKLLPCLANIYRRWYYSSLLENTYLTPANLFEALNRQYGRTSNFSPIVLPRTPINYTGLSFSFKQYNRDSHPIVADFHAIINFCRPDITLTDTDQMPEDLAYEASKTLHMNDPCYAMYLMDIAMEMGLIVKIPSIHVNRAQLVKGIEKRLEISDGDLFDKIVTSTLSFASRSLSEMIPLPVPLFDEEYLISILKDPVETDAIFQRLYDTIGVDIEDLIGLDIFEELDMLDMAVISGTYLLGIVLDKFFLTPFGHYLKLIRPIYMLPFDFNNEIEIYLDSCIEEDELGIAFYAPCSRYFLTEMGLEYFGVRPNPDNYLDIERKLDFADIAGLFDQSAKSQPDFEAISSALNRDTCIYTLKVKYMADTRIWLNIDASDTTSLHRLYLELAYYFDWDKNGEYTVFPDDTENPFMAYSSPNQTRRTKKTTDTTLGALGLEEKQVMVLSVSYPKASGGGKHKQKWAIEVMKSHQGKPGQTYPAVTRLGKALQDYFEWQ